MRWSKVCRLGNSLAALLVLSACDDSGARLNETFTAAVPAAESVSFGDVWVGTTARHAFTVQNLGTGTLNVSRLAIEGDAAFLIEGGQSKRSLGGGGALVIDLAFAPTAPGPGNAVLVLESDADNGATLRVNLTGTGVAQPDCDDANTCTSDAFDTNLGECVQTNRTGSCDADNACVTDSECVEGRCVGIGIACDDENPCTRDLCDAATGCVSLDDPDACDDDNPCTVDRCDPLTGCSSVDAPDGTQCGPVDGCSKVFACVSGECHEFPVPDGVPCDDGNVCTTNDTCGGGVCGGDRETSPPTEIARLHTYGGRSSAAVILEDDLIVFSDSDNGHEHNAFTRKSRLTLVRATQTGLEWLDELSLETEEALPWETDALLDLGDGRIAIIHEWEGFEPARYQAVRVEGTRLVPEVAEPISLETGAQCPQSCVAHAGHLYLCDTQSIRIVSLEDAAHPVATTVPLEGVCADLAIDESTNELLVAGRALGGIRRFSLADPGAPVLVNALHVSASSIAAGPGYVAYHRQSLLGNTGLYLRDSASDEEQGPFATTSDSTAWLHGGLFWFLDVQHGQEFRAALRVARLGGDEPVVRGEVPLWLSPHIPRSDDLPRHVALRGPLAVIWGTENHASRVLRLTGEPDAARLVPLTGLGHGTIGRLVPGESATTVVSPESIHELLARGEASSWLSTTMLEQPTGLVRVRGTDGLLDVPVDAPQRNAWHPAATAVPGRPTTGHLTWTDALVPAKPAVVGSLAFEAPQQLGAGLASTLFGLQRVSDGAVRVLAYDLSSLTPAFGIPPPVAASSLLPVSCARPGVFSLWWGGSIWPSRDGRFVVAACEALGAPSFEVNVFVLEREGAVFKVVGRLSTGFRYGFSFEDGLLVAAGGNRIQLYDPPEIEGGSFVLRSELTMDGAGSGQLLNRSGNHVFVEQGDRLLVYELEPELRLLGEGDGLATAHSLTVIDDNLYVAAPTTISVVHPPCPAQE